MFLLVPAYPGCPGSKAVKRSLLLLLLLLLLFFDVWCTTTVNIHVRTDEHFLQLTVCLRLGLAFCMFVLL